MSEGECFVFAGPTLYRRGEPLPLPSDVCLLPPARRGDIAARVSGNRPGLIVLVDGLFHTALAVGHEELRDALQAGWQVWGIGSMGAIRAYEMRHLGMRGYGQVYRRFETEFDFQDDEVALLHAPDPPYQAISEPLVHLRAALEEMRRQGFLSTEESAAMTTTLKSLWYGDRNLRLFSELVKEATAPSARQDVERFLANFDAYRLKTCDLEAFWRDRPWEIPQ